MQDFSWRVKPKAATKDVATRPEPRSPYDTGKLSLHEDCCGFDPYSKTELSLRPRRPLRTDLRALSAQILAERARKQSAG